jgi:hypothetical protein
MGTINSSSDSVASSGSADFIIWNGIACQVEHTFKNVAASQTDSSIVAASPGYRILVLSYQLMAGGTATDVTFNSKPAGAGTAISMLHACGANSGIASGFASYGFFKSNKSEGLTVTTGAGSTVGIQVQYALIPKS